jgi:hypothetical protein
VTVEEEVVFFIGIVFSAFEIFRFSNAVAAEEEVEGTRIASPPPGMRPTEGSDSPESGACGMFPNTPHAGFNPPLVESDERLSPRKRGEFFGSVFSVFSISIGR